MTTTLTQPQAEVVKAIALGKNVKTIASDIGVSENAVWARIINIKQRLGFRDVARLTHYAILYLGVELGKPLRD